MAIAANKRSIMTMFSGSSDIYSHQVRIVLAEKGVNVDIEYVDAENPPEELSGVNPYKSIPTLVDRELALYESRIIMEYLDERFPHPPLMPVYPVLRANSRLMMYRIEKNWYAMARNIMGEDQELAAKARETLKNEILALAPVFAEFEHFMSEDFSLIDCYMAPLLWRLPIYGIDLQGPGSKEIRRYMTKVFERESFLASLTETEREIRMSGL